MELKEFIKEALLSVVTGVDSANMIKNRFSIVGEYSKTLADRAGTYIDFDVAVTINESKESGGKSGLGLIMANVIAGKSKDKKEFQSNENVNRLKFKIFVSAR
ncbi:hypothetical protein HYS31_00030 [Candidatus Woesearchaeota archaeon]|nr:hypothetical protein [Candidatus Woesearchaeota archaeon]